jgi:hypothetical protein
MKMNNYIKIFFILIYFLILIVLCEIIISNIFSALVYNKHAKVSDGIIAFYKRHYKDLHHLREFDDNSWKLQENPNNAIYNLVSTFNGSKNRVLIQGDSWAEQFEGMLAKNALQSFSIKESVGIINAGTSSYSPSTMTIQLRKLRNEFDIHPTHIVTIIDQTDIGDELCRYANLREIDISGRLIRVNPEPRESGDLYQIEEFFEQQANLRSDKFALQKLVVGAYHKLRNSYFRKDIRCGWTQISRPLSEGISDEEKMDFIQSVNRYIEEVFSVSEIKSLILVAHPHKNHLAINSDKKYVINSAQLILLALEKSRHRHKVVLVDFLDPKIGSYLTRQNQNLYVENDPASHLTEEAFGVHFVPALLQTLKKNLRN